MRDALPDARAVAGVVQVGGGAFAACVGCRSRAVGPPRHGPDARVRAAGAGVVAGQARAADRAAVARLADVMTPWHRPHSIADGILDDETYDWLADFDAMRASGGQPVVAASPTSCVLDGWRSTAGFDVSATGSAGLAGALDGAPRSRGRRALIVVMSGVAR